MKGITVRGKNSTKEKQLGGLFNLIEYSKSITIDSCLIENVLWGNSIRISTSDYTTISNSVIRNKISGFKADNIGISVFAEKGDNSKQTLIYNNEIYDVTDGVQLVYHSTNNPPWTGDLPGTIIDNNDIYITSKLYTFQSREEMACAENGIDVKVGTDSNVFSDKVLIKNNKVWGFRKTDSSCSGSSWGDGIIIHMNAKNVIVSNNIIFDCYRGICVAGNSSGVHKVENITLENNLIHSLYSEDKDTDSGIALLLDSNVKVINNHISDVKKYLVVRNDQSITINNNVIAATKQSAPRTDIMKAKFKDNLFIDVKKPKSGAHKFKRNNFQLSKNALNLNKVNFTIKKFTKPEIVEFSNIFINEATPNHNGAER